MRQAAVVDVEIRIENRIKMARVARVLVAGRIRVISARDAVVVAWGYHCCTDGSGTNAHTHATAHIGSAISAAPIDAAHMNTADANSASIR
jgi:hypothetical protein